MAKQKIDPRHFKHHKKGRWHTDNLGAFWWYEKWATYVDYKKGKPYLEALEMDPTMPVTEGPVRPLTKLDLLFDARVLVDMGLIE